MTTTLRGKLLIATPALVDPNFDRTVLLLLEHAPDGGALGVVLNRPTEAPLAETIAEWTPLAPPPAVLYVGGPVGVGTLIALARVRGTEAPLGTEPVSGGVVAVDLSVDPAPLHAALHGLRVFTGYAGWAPGQLEQEIADDAWFVVDAEDADVTTAHPSGLWRAVLARQPGTLAWFSNFPDDPAHN